MQDESQKADWLPTGYMGDIGGFVALTNRLVNSYQRFIGSSLLPAGMTDIEQARWMYQEAPFCVLAHSNTADPYFIYANKTAQACFEYSWKEFLAMPSRLSAAAPDREERQRLFDTIARDGFSTGYRGLRIARSGRQFWIENGTIWQMIDDSGVLHGGAATFPQWRNM